MAAIREGVFPDFNEAFAELHLGQLLVIRKCLSGFRLDGWIDMNMENIIRNISSYFPRVDEDLTVGIGRQTSR